MIYKSYQVENNLKIIKENIALFYGANIGLKNEFKSSIKKNESKKNSNSERILKKTRNH